MLKDHLQIYTLSIVFIGEFNPVIFQPFWLAGKKLIRDDEAESAKVSVIHNELVRYDLDWVSVNISKERFELRTSKEPYFEPVKDLAISIFEVLKEQAIRALGVNHVIHYALPDEKIYYEFGNKLAPLKNWSDFLNDPKLFYLQIGETKRSDGLYGKYHITIQPSEKKLTTKYGVVININDHMSAYEDETKHSRNGELIKILKDQWSASLKRAAVNTEKIWEKINAK